MFLSNCKVALARGSGLSTYPAIMRHYATAEARLTRTSAASLIPELLDSLFRDTGRGTDANVNGNPCSLSPLIRRGDTVVLKPNWVMHRNASGHDLNCLVTHPFVIALVLDEVLKAGPSRVIVGHAP